MILSFSKMNVPLWHQNQVISIVVLNLFVYISFTLLYLCTLSFGVSLLRFKYLATLKNCKEMWWYKLLFTFFTFLQLCFYTKYIFFTYEVKPKMFIGIIWLFLYSSFYFICVFQGLSSVCFILFLNVFCTPTHNQANHDSKVNIILYDINKSLLDSSTNR